MSIVCFNYMIFLMSSLHLSRSGFPLKQRIYSWFKFMQVLADMIDLPCRIAKGL